MEDKILRNEREHIFELFTKMDDKTLLRQNITHKKREQHVCITSLTRESRQSTGQ